MKHRFLNYQNPNPSGGGCKSKQLNTLLKSTSLLLIFCCLSFSSWAQATWTGNAMNGLWNDSGNWTIASGSAPLGYPQAGFDNEITIPTVVLPATALNGATMSSVGTIGGTKLTLGQNLVVPSGVILNITNSTTNGVEIQASTSLTVSTGATLNVSNSVNHGINITAVGGNLTNQGTISIDGTSPSNTGIGYHGINIAGDATVSNAGVLNINNIDVSNDVPGDGINLSNGKFTNTSIVNIATIGGHGILNADSLINTGTITIDSTNANGDPSDDGHGIFNIGGTPVFINETSGKLKIVDIPTSSNGIRASGGSFTNRGNIEINDIDMSGIVSSAEFCNTGTLSLASIVNDATGVTGISKDAIEITAGNFRNKPSGLINIGSGSGVGGNGINIIGPGSFIDSSFVNIDSTGGNGISLSIGGSYTHDDSAILTIQNAKGNGINIDGTSTFISRDTAIIRIPTGITMSGINNAGTFNLNTGALLEIGVGGTTGAIGLADITNSGIFTTDNKGTKIVLDNATTFSINNSGTFTNNITSDNDFVVIETNNGINITGGMVINQSIILMERGFNTSAGLANSLRNAGIIVDHNGSILSALDNMPTRTLNNMVDLIDNGLVVAPYLAMCRTGVISNYLFGNPNASALGISFFPTANWTMSGAPAATLDTATNQLTLLVGTMVMDLDFEILAGGTSCNVFSKASLAFDRGNAGAIACNSNVNIALDNNCIAKITPDMILEDDGGCTEGYKVELLEGSKIGTDTLDSTYLGQTVKVKVTDPSGLNSCWGTITIEDTYAPVLVCRDTFVYCTQSTDAKLLGFPTGVDACGGPVTFTFTDVNQVGVSCGVDPSNPDTMSTIIRTFTGRDESGNASTCVQRIYVLRPTMADVRIPASLTGSNALQCSDAKTDPNVTGRPFFLINGDTILVEAICKFGVDLDEKISNLGCTGKSRIVRTWTIWDWCHISAGNAVAADTQVIDIVDTIAPTFDSLRLSELQVLTVSAHKCMANVKPPVPQNLADLCSGVTYQILGPTGTIYNNPLDSFTNVPLGEMHTLEYIISDSCGNQVRDTLTFQIEDTTDPLALAKDLTINLVDGAGNTWVYATSFDGGSTDNCGAIDSVLISKDGINFADRIAFDCSDIGVQTLTLKVVDKAGNVATAAREASITDTGGHCPSTPCMTTAVIDSVRTTLPTCGDNNNGTINIFAKVPVGVAIQYSIDSGVTFLNSTSTFNMIGMNENNYVFIRETSQPNCWIPYVNNPVSITECASSIAPTSTASIAGHIQNENGELIEDVNISIGGYEMAPEVTGANGTFMFEEIPLTGNYMITPEKDMNHSNGITTFDLVLMSKHVLGLKPLDSPYKMIAADINHSGTISAYDMVLLRQVILGVKDDFPNNTSWRFIDADYEFLRPENPFVENYPEAYEINSLSADMMTLDFIGVKIGDVNNSAAANQLMTAESRNTNKSLNFQVAEQVKKAGEVITVDFTANNFQSILGYQFTLDFDGNALGFEQILIGQKAGFENFNLSMIQRGMITTSWSQPEATNIATDEVLFSLVFKAKENIRLSEVLQIGSDITAAEAYTGTEELINVNLDIQQSTPNNAGFKLYQNKPNPFTGETIIGFDLPTASATTMTIFDMSGKVVKVLGGNYEKGYNQILIDGKAFNDHGMFYYQLATDNGIETKKMILLKQ